MDMDDQHEINYVQFENENDDTDDSTMIISGKGKEQRRSERVTVDHDIFSKMQTALLVPTSESDNVIAYTDGNATSCRLNIRDCKEKGAFYKHGDV